MVPSSCATRWYLANSTCALLLFFHHLSLSCSNTSHVVVDALLLSGGCGWLLLQCLYNEWRGILGWGYEWSGLLGWGSRKEQVTVSRRKVEYTFHIHLLHLDILTPY
jgi:hypothetical protein